MSVTPAGFTSFNTTTDELANAVDQLVSLVNADSTSGAEGPGVDAAEAICDALELPLRRISAAPGRDNLLVGHPEPRLIMCTHLDTVPPFIGASTDESYVYGRGSADAKGVAVAMLHALVAVRRATSPDVPVACLLVVGEETDHIGAKAFVETGLRPDHIILGEPCGMRPAIAQKGLLKLRLTARGRAGHSAYPDVGVSALHALLDALEALRASPLPADDALGSTTLNVGEVRGGVAANVIAPSAEATLLLRCAAPVDAVLADVTSRIPEGVRLEELSRAEPLEYNTAGEPAGPAVPFNTDGSILAATGAHLMLMGPGDMRCAHAAGERLAKSDLAEGIERFAAMVMRLL